MKAWPITIKNPIAANTNHCPVVGVSQTAINAMLDKDNPIALLMSRICIGLSLPVRIFIKIISRPAATDAVSAIKAAGSNEPAVGRISIIDPANPIRKKRPMPPIPLGEDGVLIAKAFDKLGWHWWPSDNYINSTNYNGRDSCNYCGAVHLGCPRGAKASTDITYWPEAKKFGVKLITHCRVTKITTSKEVLTAGIADSKTAKILHINKGDPVVILNRHSYAKDKGLVEFRITTGRADMFSYRTTIGNNDY